VTAVSLALVLSAACLHASWNLLAKRAGSGGAEFVWLFGALSSVLYLPLAAIALLQMDEPLGRAQIGFMVGSGALHLCYFTLLQYGYRAGDLSVVYPLARGTGPMLSTTFAILLFGERPSAVALTGAALVCAGVIVVGTGRSATDVTKRTSVAVVFGLATGGLIATYTLWDKRAVAVLLVPPLLLDWAANFVRTLLLTPVAMRRRVVVARVWNSHRREAIGIALMAPAAYILVLTALAVTPVSYVAPAREVSILIGTVLGARLLGEQGLGRRLVGAAAIVSGLVVLALG
jgi:drug/metabolite transporter (DMT)-like permease